MLTHAQVPGSIPFTYKLSKFTYVCPYTSKHAQTYVHTEKFKEAHLYTDMFSCTRILTPSTHNTHASTWAETHCIPVMETHMYYTQAMRLG